jgi:hypothetical protein
VKKSNELVEVNVKFDHVLSADPGKRHPKPVEK